MVARSTTTGVSYGEVRHAVFGILCVCNTVFRRIVFDNFATKFASLFQCHRKITRGVTQLGLARVGSAYWYAEIYSWVNAGKTGKVGPGLARQNAFPFTVGVTQAQLSSVQAAPEEITFHNRLQLTAVFELSDSREAQTGLIGIGLKVTFRAIAVQADTLRNQQGAQIPVHIINHVQLGKAIQLGLGAIYIQVNCCSTYAHSHQRQACSQATCGNELEITFHSVVIHCSCRSYTVVFMKKRHSDTLEQYPPVFRQE